MNDTSSCNNHSPASGRQYLLYIVCFLLLMSCPSTAFPQQRYTPYATKYDWSGLAESIVRGKTSKYDQAYAIYRWLCDNIAYDTSYTIHDADRAYEQKKGVCQAYSEMFYRLGEPIGLQVDVITGRSKDFHGKLDDSGHSWVFVYTNGNSGILIDPTWGAGAVDGTVFTRNEDDDSWFHVDPRWMIFSHYPDIDAYQLMDNKLSFDEFSRLPYYAPSLSAFGFDPGDIFADCMEGKAPDLPDCHLNRRITVIDIPLEGTVKVGRSYDFAVKSGGNFEYAVVNGDEWHTDWHRSGSVATTSFIPSSGGDMKLLYKEKGSTDSWTQMVKYSVARPTASDIASLEAAAPHKSPALTSLKNYRTDILKTRGVDFTSLLAAVKRDNIRELPIFYNAGDFKVNSVPMNGVLHAGQTYTFRFSPYEAGEWVIINGDEWLREWTQDPVTKAWVMTVVAAPGGKLKLSYKPAAETDNLYTACIEYRID